MFMKPKNIVEAIQARQLGYEDKNIFNETAEDIMSTGFEQLIKDHRKLSPIYGEMQLAKISVDGTILACVSEDLRLTVLNVYKKKVLKTCWILHDYAGDLALSPLSKENYFVVAVICCQNIFLWNSDFEDPINMKVQECQYGISFHPTKSVLAVMREHNIFFWDYVNNKKIVVAYEASCGYTLAQIHYSPIKNYMLIEKRNGKPDFYCIEEIDVRDNGIVKNFKSDRKITYKDGTSLQLEINKEYTKLAVHFVNFRCNDYTLNVYSLQRNQFGTILYQMSGECVPKIVSFSPLSRYLLLKHKQVDNGDFVLVNTATKEEMYFEDDILPRRTFMWSSNIHIGLLSFIEYGRLELDDFEIDDLI